MPESKAAGTGNVAANVQQAEKLRKAKIWKIIGPTMDACAADFDALQEEATTGVSGLHKAATDFSYLLQQITRENVRFDRDLTKIFDNLPPKLQQELLKEAAGKPEPEPITVPDTAPERTPELEPGDPQPVTRPTRIGG